jgi:hypothetical protein
MTKIGSSRWRWVSACVLGLVFGIAAVLLINAWFPRATLPDAELTLTLPGAPPVLVDLFIEGPPEKLNASVRNAWSQALDHVVSGDPSSTATLECVVYRLHDGKTWASEPPRLRMLRESTPKGERLKIKTRSTPSAAWSDVLDIPFTATQDPSIPVKLTEIYVEQIRGVWKSLAP